jgi:thioredoxin reductase
MAKQRKVRTITGAGRFVSPNEIEIETGDGKKLLRFGQCIIAAGSQPVKLPGFPWDDPRVMDSTDALMLADIPKRLLVVGGGIIGLEMACVYAGLGSQVTVVEFMPQLMPGTDPDLVKPLADLLKKRGVAIHVSTKVAKVEAKKDGLHATFEGDKPPGETRFDRALVSVGRSPQRRPASTSVNAASSSSTNRCARTCRMSSRSAIWSASRCWRTRPRMKASSRRKSLPAKNANGWRGQFPRSPIPIRKSPGSASPKPRRKRKT